MIVSKRLLQLLETQSSSNLMDDWEYSKMHEGTNNIFKIFNKHSKEKYALKIYNKCSKINHALEHNIIEYLAELKRHPSIIYSSNDYRIEEFIEDSKVDILQLRSLSKLMQVIELIASLHSDSQLRDNILPAIEDKRPFVLAVNESWLNSFREVYYEIQETLKNTKYEEFSISLSFLLTEDFQELFRSLMPNTSEVVLSHNDISAANLLSIKNNDKVEMYLIDYEYCRLNYRSYDLATLFEDLITDYKHPEYPSFKIHHELAITPEEEDILLRHYISTRKLPKATKGVDMELKKLKQEVISLRIIFQLAATLWGLTTHDWSKKGFDENNCWRIEYAKQRWTVFQEYIKKYYYDDQTSVIY